MATSLLFCLCCYRRRLGNCCYKRIENICTPLALIWNYPRNFRQHGVYVLLPFANEHNEDVDYGQLPNASWDAEKVRTCMAVEARYHQVYRTCLNASAADMMARFNQLVQFLQGTINALVVIYFAGHGVDIQGVLHWVGNDGSMLNMAEVCEFLIGAEGIINPTFVFLSDCCRSVFNAETRHLPLNWDADIGNVPWHARPHFVFFYATEAGGEAHEGRPNEHSPFCKAFCREVVKPQSLYNLCHKVQREVENQTQFQQRPVLWPILDDLSGSTCLMNFHLPDEP